MGVPEPSTFARILTSPAFRRLHDWTEFSQIHNGGYFVEWRCGVDLPADTVETRWKSSIVDEVGVMEIQGNAELAAAAREEQHYLAALRARIERKKYYPRVSQRRAEEGKVIVSFVIRKNGEFTDLAVVESSGIDRLDDAALETLRRITPFKPIPAALGRKRWALSVPISYNLKD